MLLSLSLFLLLLLSLLLILLFLLLVLFSLIVSQLGFSSFSIDGYNKNKLIIKIVNIEKKIFIKKNDIYV